jgi:hypothetical protein
MTAKFENGQLKYDKEDIIYSYDSSKVIFPHYHNCPTCEAGFWISYNQENYRFETDRTCGGNVPSYVKDDSITILIKKSIGGLLILWGVSLGIMHELALFLFLCGCGFYLWGRHEDGMERQKIEIMIRKYPYQEKMKDKICNFNEPQKCSITQ